MQITVLGSGSSGGVPLIGGHWGECDPTNKKNIRTRCCAHIQYNKLSILVIIFLDIGFVKDVYVSSILPFLLISILWKFHFGIADLPWFSFAHLNIECALSPLTSVIVVIGKLILKLTSQKS